VVLFRRLFSMDLHLIFQVQATFTVLLFLSLESSYSQTPPKGFEGLKGTIFTHTIADKSDSLSLQVINEFRDEKGVSLWFSRDFHKTVCLTGVCKMIRIRIFWTGAESYLGLQLLDNDSLTKSDHKRFNKEDYIKLDHILSDSLSILKRLKFEEMIIKAEKKGNNQVDAIAGATLPSVSEFVVKDAVYTCYTLWHTVYGPTLEKIRSILDQRTNKDYLRLVFDRKEPVYSCWAIHFVERHPQHHSIFYREIMNMIKSENDIVSQKALHYFAAAILSETGIQKELAHFLEDVPARKKFEIIMNFLSLRHVSNEAILIMLEQFENQIISAAMLSYVCKLIHTDNMEDIRIEKKIISISRDKNQYVRNMTQILLSNYNNKSL